MSSPWNVGADCPWDEFAGWGSAVDASPYLKHGRLSDWLATVDALPDEKVESFSLGRQVGPRGPAERPEALAAQLMALKPWRKGPFEFFGTAVDTEWRSDLKWDRISHALSNPTERVLDVGCGSGYHLWRLLEQGHERVLGIDPGVLFACQFLALKKYAPGNAPEFWPVPLEALPERAFFDWVLSMGVLYHRRSPLDHLSHLKALLRPGGRVLLETLVIEGDERACLTPADRYANMKNCWFIPSVDLLTVWLRRVGFKSVECLDVSPTTVAEQRATAWSTDFSLHDALSSSDPSRTVEGHPAPLRAVLTCGL